MNGAAPWRIEDAASPEAVETVRSMLAGHLAGIEIDPTFGGLQEEIARLPGVYARPQGALLLVRDAGDHVLGMAAMRPLPGPGACDISGIFVAPEARGRGIGTALAQALIAAAQAAGHSRVHATTTPDSAAAALFQQLGFLPCAPYFANPRPDAESFCMDLLPSDEG